MVVLRLSWRVAQAFRNLGLLLAPCSSQTKVTCTTRPHAIPHPNNYNPILTFPRKSTASNSPSSWTPPLPYP